jgi:hypothetical protein
MTQLGLIPRQLVSLCRREKHPTGSPVPGGVDVAHKGSRTLSAYGRRAAASCKSPAIAGIGNHHDRACGKVVQEVTKSDIADVRLRLAIYVVIRHERLILSRRPIPTAVIKNGPMPREVEEDDIAGLACLVNSFYGRNDVRASSFSVDEQ